MEEKLIDSLIKSANRTLNKFWDSKYKEYGVSHVFDIKQDLYKKCIAELKPIMAEALVAAEKVYVANTEDPKEYPNGCIQRANRSWNLFERWDAIFRKIIQSWEVYS